jgi:Holliday junction resolvasome RuvABC DNA-binding subunit
MSYKLEDVSGIGKATAERLKAANIDSVEKLANAKLEDLVKLKIKGVGKTTAEKYIASAKDMLKELQITEQISNEVKEEFEENVDSKSKTEPKAKLISKVESNSLKELIKHQAECNIGLVGHVDHGNY